MKKYSNFILCLLLCIHCFDCAYAAGKTINVLIHNRVYVFEIAQTEKDRQAGLMSRKNLAPESGMLFLYENPGYIRFYMKNTFIALDIAFIDENFRITQIESMAPLSEVIVSPRQKAKYALEVNRGFFKKAGVKTGDKIEFVK